MSFIPEESQKDRELRRQIELGVEDDPSMPSSLKSREYRRKQTQANREEYWEHQKNLLKYKEGRQKWLEKRSEEKRKEREEDKEAAKKRREEKETPKIEMGSVPDTPTTSTPGATTTVLTGLGSYARAALSAGARKARAAMERRKKEKQEKAAKAAEAASEAQRERTQAQRERTQAAMAQSTKLLPGGRDGETLGQQARRDRTTFDRENRLQSDSLAPKKPPKPPHPDGPDAKKFDEETFSCWREEFLYELGEMRRNKKEKDAKERIIDVMKGQNKITIGPNESETGINEGRKLSRLKTTVKKIAQKVEIPLLVTSFALSAGQSPKAFIRSGHIEAPGFAGMQRLMDPRKKSKNLDLGRVSHPARNKKLGEGLSREELLKAIVLKLINEKKRKNSLLNNQYIGEETAAWTRKEGKNPTGGLNKKGVASYRRENPGSNLQTAVTTPPSKLKPNSKAAKRRKSFCARMSGMPGPMKDEKGRPTRKALSLRKWNC